jgi:hypothetical protein
LFQYKVKNILYIAIFYINQEIQNTALNKSFQQSLSTNPILDLTLKAFSITLFDHLIKTSFNLSQEKNFSIKLIQREKNFN